MQEKARILARQGARELQPKEMEMVCAAGDKIRSVYTLLSHDPILIVCDYFC